MKTIFVITLSIALFSGNNLYAFDGSVHNQITLAAVKVFNDCLKFDPELKPIHEIDDKLSKLVANKNKNEDGTLFTYQIRFGNWHFYNTNNTLDDGWPRHFFDEIFDKKITYLNQALLSGRPVDDLYVKAGSVMHYVQDVSSPPHVAPVYHWKFLGMGIKEPFDVYKLNESLYKNELSVTQDQCKELLAWNGDFKEEILKVDAKATLAVLDQEIPGQNDTANKPHKWSSFWRPASSSEPACNNKKPKDGFGTYGQFCNNFGEIKPLLSNTGDFVISNETYNKFFLSQFIQARNSSVKVLAWVMRKNMGRQ